MRRPPTVLRTAAALLLMPAAMGLATACGTSGPGGSSGGDTINLWEVQSDTRNPVTKAAADEFNKTSKVKINITTYVNDAYKQKLQVSMGSDNAPDIFFNWGGGNLAQYVNANQVADLSDAMAKNPTVKDAFLPSVLKIGAVNGKQYGVPMSGMQPAVLFYNTDVFASAGVQPPKTYDELLTLVDTFKAKGVTPIALAGSQGWTELMYLMYLLDRIGGPSKFDAIAAGTAGAWKDESVLKALQMCQDLAKKGAFGSNFSSVNYDNTGAGKLLATGKAAMHLMGTWEYSSQVSNNPDFVKGGKMGFVNFPSVAGGAGDPKNVVGPPSNYFSVTANSKHKDVAIDFLTKFMTADSFVTGLVKTGEVPAVKGSDAKMAGTDSEKFATFVYKTVSDAPSFTPAWDQALSPSVGTELNSNLQKLFLAQISPEQFADAMAKAK